MTPTGKKEGVKVELKGSDEKRVLPSASTALVVGSALGFVEFVVLMLGSGPILNIRGVFMKSNMRVPAEQYLAPRAIGAPAVDISLAVQVAGHVINIILVPILMFSLELGVSGAAIATVISQVCSRLLVWDNQDVFLCGLKGEKKC